jgi:hypothetical protein
MSTKSRKVIPHSFVLEALDDLDPILKPMFGTVGVYIYGAIVFALRDRPTSIRDNGVWLATSAEHHASLQRDFPSMRSLELFGPGPTGWQVLPVDAEDFEESVLLACRLVRARDPRIGKLPKMKKSRSKARARK